jgi:protein TorT
MKRKKSAVWMSICVVFVLAGFLFVVGAPKVSMAGEDPMAKWALKKPWYPLEIYAWYGKFDVKTLPGGLVDLPATSLDGPKKEMWAGPAKANKPYHIGYTFPHLMDPYWTSVLYGVIDEARLAGVNVSALTAGGYGNVERQNDQIETLVSRGVDGLLIGVVSFAALTPTLEEAAKKGVKVLLLVNDCDMENPIAKSFASYYRLGDYTGDLVINDSKEKRARGEKVTVAFFPGPGGLAWSTSSLLGFKARIKEKGLEDQIVMVAEKWGKSEKAIQLNLLEPVLTTFPDLDYVAGNAVFADAAVVAVENAGRTGKTKVVSAYMTPQIYRHIKDGKILGAPHEFQQHLGRLAIDQMVRTLNGEKPGVDFPYHVMPVGAMMSQDNLDSFPHEFQFQPDGWQPIFEYKVPD